MPVSFDLTEDQLELQKWVHQFAADIVRPAAAAYDEREVFPWEVLREAAKIGLYSLGFFATQWFDESGLGIPLTMEELFWGDAGIGLAIVGTTLAAASVRANGTDEQVGQWIPAMFGTEAEPRVAAFCSSEPDAGSDVAALRTRAVHDEATDEWVLTGTKTWAWSGPAPPPAHVVRTGGRAGSWSAGSRVLHTWTGQSATAARGHVDGALRRVAPR